MPPKRNRNRFHTPAWVDTLIAWLDLAALIGTLLAGAYALFTFFE